VGELGNEPIESVTGDLGGVDPKAALIHQRRLERTGQLDSQPNQNEGVERDAGDDDQGWAEPAPNPVDEAMGDARATDEQAAAFEETAAEMDAAGNHAGAEDYRKTARELRSQAKSLREMAQQERAKWK
jgi:hypothetical protein